MGGAFSFKTIPSLGLAVLMAGCSGALPSLELPASSETTTAASAAMPAMPSLAKLLPGDSAVGTPTEVYTRIARGALTCWFGAAGPLKAQYIYHAEAAPPSKGGHSQIEIFVRDPTAADPRSQRAYRIAILPSGDSAAKVEIENLKIPEPLSTRMSADVARWSADEGGCGDDAVTVGWSAEPQPPGPEPGKKKPPNRKR